MDQRSELEELRRLDELEAKASGTSFGNVSGGMKSTEATQKPSFGDVRAGSVSSEPATAKPSLFRADSDFRESADLGFGDMLWASAKDMFGSRQGAAEYLANKAGGSVGQDADGSPVVVLKDGKRYRTNDAGLDSTDIGNVAGNVAALWTPAGWASKFSQARNMGLLGRMVTQSGTAAAGESGLMALFNDGRIDPTRVALAGAGGAGGELLGSGIGAVANRTGPVLRGLLGSGTEDAGALLKQHGVTQTPEALSRARPLVEQSRAGADPKAITGGAKYDFAYTLGQRLQDPARKFQQLSREEALRQTPGGFAAFDGMARGNASKLDDALAGLGEQFGARTAATPAEMTQGSASGLRQQADDLSGRIDKAYQEAGDKARMAVGADTIADMPSRLRGAVHDFDIHPQTTPAAARALEQIREATQTTLAGITGGNVKGVTLRALETQRRILNKGQMAATNPTDRAAMTAIRREFDGWLDDAVENALVSGDKGALESMRNARALRAEFGRRFEGGQEADRFIAGLLDGSRTPEELLNVALGSAQVSKAGASRFIDRLKVAANNDPEVMGGLRAAHFTRLTRGGDGKPLSLASIVGNIRKTEYSNASATHALYTPAQWREVKQLADALEPMIAKGDFAKSSGSIERLARMLGDKLGGSKVGTVWKMATSSLPGIQAQRAITTPVRLPAVAPAGTAPLGAAYWQERNR